MKIKLFGGTLCKVESEVNAFLSYLSKKGHAEKFVDIKFCTDTCGAYVLVIYGKSTDGQD